MKKRGLFVLFFIFLIISSVYALSLSIFEKNILKVTQEHPFLINGNWVEAKDLVVGDELVTIDGRKARIVSIEDVNESVDVYNLEVEKYSDFVVGEGIVVHNSNAVVNPEGIDCIGASCPVRVKYPNGKVEEMTLGKFYYRFESNPALKLINAYNDEIPLEELVRIYDPDQTVKMVSFTVEGQVYKVTENTRVQLASGEFIEASELVPGTRLRVPGSRGEITAFNRYEATGIQVFEPKFKDSVYDTPFQVGGTINGPTLKNPYPSSSDKFLDALGRGESKTTRKSGIYDFPDSSFEKDISVFENDYGNLIMPDDPEAVYAQIRGLPENDGKIFDNPLLKDNQIFLESGKPADGGYIWTINEQGELTIGLRGSRQQFLPHPALANGERVFGAGEIVIENGRIIEINPKSGHYLPTNSNPLVQGVQRAKFSEESVYAFKKFLEANGFSKEEIKKIAFNTFVD